MIPFNAKIIVPNQKAIQFDDANKCIRLWRNTMGVEWVPFWEEVGVARNDEALNNFIPAKDVSEDMFCAIAYFWQDCGLISED